MSRSLASATFVGHLNQCDLLSIVIMHYAVVRLLAEGKLEQTDDDSLRCLCSLLTLVGQKLEAEDAGTVAGGSHTAAAGAAGASGAGSAAAATQRGYPPKFPHYVALLEQLAAATEPAADGESVAAATATAVCAPHLSSRSRTAVRDLLCQTCCACAATAERPAWVRQH